jgi:IS30 family transposase
LGAAAADRATRTQAAAGTGDSVLAGTDTFKAGEIIGIGRKADYRRRAENGGLPPIQLVEAARSGRYLSLLERGRIAALHRQGLGVREIAARLDRAPSPVGGFKSLSST